MFRKFRHLLIIILTILIILPVYSEAVKIASWNILNFPGTTGSAREDDFRNVIEQLDLDILVVQEMLSEDGVNQFLDNILNYSSPGTYEAAPFINGPDSDNALFYKKSSMRFISHYQISTSLRDISEYWLEIKEGPATGIAFGIYSVHLKAGTGTDNEAQREEEATILRNYMNDLPSNSLFLVCGDFNMRSSNERAFQILTETQADNDGRTKDPIDRLGYWHDNAEFADIHTQSTRTTQFGGGATGGLDDRFDLILISHELETGERLIYEGESYLAYGNDGNHLNMAVNEGTNLAVGSDIADALHEASDHLPVVIELESPGSVTISGVVKTDEDEGVDGVTVTFSDGEGATTTDLDGYYDYTISSGWSGTATPSKTGYTFSPDYRLYDNITSDQADQDYVATLLTYTLSIFVNPAGAGTIARNPDKISYTHGEDVNLTANPNSGYIFDEWSGGVPQGHENDNPLAITMDSDKSITANFIREYTLTIASSLGGTTDPSPGIYTYDEGTEVTITATPNPYYRFKNWSGDISGTNSLVELIMNADISTTANFIRQYTLTISVGKGGTANPAPGSHIYDTGTTVKITAIPDNKYEFKEWSGNASGVSNPITIITDSDKSVTAHFKKVCLIASSVYGSPFHPHVKILRDFRDEYLMDTRLGCFLVNSYYRYSSFFTYLIGEHKALKLAARINLLPLISFSYSMVHLGPIVTGIIAVFVFAIPFFFVPMKGRKRNKWKSEVLVLAAIEKIKPKIIGKTIVTSTLTTIMLFAFPLFQVGSIAWGMDYWMTVDEHNKGLPVDWYYNNTGGDRGVLNAEDIKYTWDGYSITAEVKSQTGLWTWGGMWYSLNKIIGSESEGVDFDAIFGPYILPDYQGQIIGIEIVLSSVSSSNPDLELRLEIKDSDDSVLKIIELGNLIPGTYPHTFRVNLDPSEIGKAKVISWIIDRAKIGDSVTVDRVRLKANIPEANELPSEEQAFLWSYSWLMENYDQGTGMVQDRSNFESGVFENVSATAKAAKITYYAYHKGYVSYQDAKNVITKIADTLINSVPRGPSAVNFLWPHFTENGGTQIVTGTEWASGDTAYAALDIICALQMLGDPENQNSSLVQFLKDINWEGLLLSDGCISQGYYHDGTLIPYSWIGFGMETVGVNWAYASCTGNVTAMGPPPSDNGSGFIDNAHYPVVLSGIDCWNNDWDAYRSIMADNQINWYSSPEHFNPYLSSAGLFGLSAAETPEADGTYIAYGTGNLIPPNDGNGEVIVLHYSGMIADIRPDEAKQVWEVLKDRSAEFLQDKIVLSPLNNMESMRVDKNTGECIINYLKGSWNLALQAEGWALMDADIRNILLNAIYENAFLYGGYKDVRKCSDIVITPDAFSAGEVDVGSSKIQTFTISNSGTGNLVIDTLSIEGQDASDFSIENDNCSGQTINPSETCTVDVVFSPASEGLKSSSLLIQSNDPDTPTLNVQLSGKGVLAQDAPTVTTGSATSVTASSATLNGVVNPNGASTNFYFEYGTTTSFGSTSAIADAGSGTIDVSVSADITGLTAETSYHFRIVATNSGGTSYGEEQTFMTSMLTYTISGLVSEVAAGLGDVIMNGLPGNPTTDVNGNYSAVVDYDWSGTVTPSKAGYTFDPSSRSYTNVNSEQLNQDYTAMLLTYTLSTFENPSGGGTIAKSPDKDSYTHGEYVSLTAYSNTGYTFDDWSGDVPQGHENDNPLTITMDSDKSITANFIRRYTLTIASSLGGTTDPSPGTYTYDEGTEVSIKAIPDSGHEFKEWSGDSSGTSNPIRITMDSNKSVKAIFKNCFIATAAYDSPSHPHVRILRDFRDKYLVTNKLGRKLVELYYEYSPFLADLIAKHSALKFVARINLLPLIVFCYSMIHFGPTVTAVILVFIFMLTFYFVFSAPRKSTRVKGSLANRLVMKNHT